MFNRKVPYFNITDQPHYQKVLARFEMLPWKVAMAICQTLLRISVFGLWESFSIAWKSPFMAWNFKYQICKFW